MRACETFVYTGRRECPICGKEFSRTAEWAYVIQGISYCSWSCYRKGEEKEEALSEQIKKSNENSQWERRKEEIVSLLKKGKTIPEIRQITGVSYRHIEALRRITIPISRPVLTLDQELSVCRMVAQGATIKEAAESHGLSYNTARKACAEHGLTRGGKWTDG